MGIFDRNERSVLGSPLGASSGGGGGGLTNPLANNTPLQWNDTGSSPVDLLNLDGSDIFFVGDEFYDTYIDGGIITISAQNEIQLLSGIDQIFLKGVSGSAELRFFDANLSNFVGFKSAAVVSTDVTWTLPASDGTSGQVLSTNGTGTLSWATVSGGGTPAGANGEVQFNNSGAFGAEPNLFWDATNNRLGIRQNSPQYPLHVLTDAYAFYGQGTVGGVFSGWESQDGVIVQLGAQSGGASKLGTQTSDDFSLSTNNVNRFTITPAGNCIAQSGWIRPVTSNGAPASGGEIAGSIYFDTGTNKLKVYNGSTWEEITST